MPYAMPVAVRDTPSEAEARPQVVYSRNARASCANDAATSEAGSVQPVEPMLLVYRERAETFRLIAAALRRGLSGLARWFGPTARPLAAASRK